MTDKPKDVIKGRIKIKNRVNGKGLFKKIDDERVQDFVCEIRDFIQVNCNRFGFKVNVNESSMSNGYNLEINCYSITFGVYLNKLDSEDLEN